MGSPQNNPLCDLCLSVLGYGGGGTDLDPPASQLMMRTCVGLPRSKSSNPAWVPASLPKGQGPKNPFHLARGLREGRGGGESGLGSVRHRPGAADLPGCSAWPPASEPARQLPSPGLESGDAPSPPPGVPGVGARALETRRLWLMAATRAQEPPLARPSLVGGGGGWGRGGQGKGDPKPHRRFPSPHLRLSLCPNCLSPVGLTLSARPFSAANLARNLDPRPGKWSSSPTPPRHLPSGRCPRLRARAWPRARAKKLGRFGAATPIRPLPLGCVNAEDPGVVRSVAGLHDEAGAREARPGSPGSSLAVWIPELSLKTQLSEGSGGGELPFPLSSFLITKVAHKIYPWFLVECCEIIITILRF